MDTSRIGDNSSEDNNECKSAEVSELISIIALHYWQKYGKSEEDVDLKIESVDNLLAFRITPPNEYATGFFAGVVSVMMEAQEVMPFFQNLVEKRSDLKKLIEEQLDWD